MKEENKVKLICPRCKDIIFSEYPGQYKKCSCGFCAIDQGDITTRYLAENMDELIEYNKEEIEKHDSYLRKKWEKNKQE